MIAIPPGHSINEALNDRDITVTDFANRIEYNVDDVMKLLYGKLPIDLKIASEMSVISGNSIGFWLNLEALYREKISKIYREYEKFQRKLFSKADITYEEDGTVILKKWDFSIGLL